MSRGKNSEFDWDRFDPDLYHETNYRVLRDDDQQIIERVRDFFGACGVSDGDAVDVGAASNLYPAFAMLPFSRTLTFYDRSDPNVKWLNTEISGFGQGWDEFWNIYRRHPRYAAIEDPRTRLSSIATACQRNLFDLPERQWDLGTMFFVACSISSELAEFDRATRRFVRSLKPGAPFAAAFMESSVGYSIGAASFPAVQVKAERVKLSLAAVADHDVVTISTDDPLLRAGYSGRMILATGRAKSSPD